MLIFHEPASDVRRLVSKARPHLLATAVGVATVWMAYDDGTYGLTSRSSVAIAVWWTVIVAVAVRLWPLRPLPMAGIAAIGLTAALALVTAASMFWSSSAEDAFTEFNRVVLYLGVLVLVSICTTRRSAAQWCDGVAAAIAVVGVIALVSRFFPSVFPARALSAFLPASATRLSFPVGYWNGLGIFEGLGIPLLLRSAMLARSVVARSAAVGAIPIVGSTIYLTSSRGGAATLAAATAAFLVATPTRARAVGALLTGAVGAGGAIAVLHARNAIVNGPLGTATAVSQGHAAALQIALIAVATGGVYAAASTVLSGRVRVSRKAGWASIVVVVAGAAAACVAAHPVRLFDEFKQPPGKVDTSSGGFVQAHLLSGNGTGRWQFWQTALREFESAPIGGHGAGSYEAWWAQHGSISYFVIDAHSLYLETMGELGIVGFLIVVAVVVLGIATAARRAVRARGPDRTTIGALLGVFVGYALGAGIDWMWELSIVSIVAFVSLGLIAGPASDTRPAAQLVRPKDSRRRWSHRLVSFGLASLVVGWLLICAQAIPLISQLKIQDSQAASRRGDGWSAISNALAAHSVQPWAYSPYVQLALVTEEFGNVSAASRYIHDAIARDRDNWRLWLIDARIQTKLGHIQRAVTSLSRAKALNPRSPLFANL
jgi:hypothetical protein